MRLGRKLALGFVTMSLIALIVPAGTSAVETPVIHIDKSLQTGQPGYYTPGDSITFRYEITGNDRFIDVVVTDNKCAAVTPVLGGGPGGVYNIGDTISPFGALNGLGPETWVYTCTTTVPGGVSPDATSTNTARVTATTPWPAFPGPFTDDDTFTLKGAILRKLVVLFWDYSHYVAYPPAANVAFAVDVYNGATKVGTETVKASDPLELWFGPGTWKLQEQTPSAPYLMIPGRGTWNDVTAGAWRDNTFFNYIQYDLGITKYGPAIREAGQTVTYEYKVTNDGPASVKPVVTDDKCSPVTFASGDTNTDGLIQPSETWTFVCTHTPNWAAVFNAGSPWSLKNTATVVADEYPENFTPLYGGDEYLSDNSAHFKLYAFVLRKDVGLYTGATPDYTFADTQPFTVKAYRNGVLKKEFTIAEGSPKYLWLSHGTWAFKEVNLPVGYVAIYPNATITFATGSGYPDWTHLNMTWLSGCSLGYWKNHTADWPAGYLPGDRIDKYFAESDYYDATSLLTALSFPGGSGVEGAERLLLKQAVASLLNEAEFGTAFGPYASVAALKTAVNAALASGSRTTMLSLASTLDHWNNGVCR